MIEIREGKRGTWYFSPILLFYRQLARAWSIFLQKVARGMKKWVFVRVADDEFGVRQELRFEEVPDETPAPPPPPPPAPEPEPEPVVDNLKERVDPMIDDKILELREKFPEYFGGTITETIKIQIKESQDEVVEALYPIIGKLIKKFIVAEVAKLSENINQTINEKFAPSQIMKRFFKGKRTNAKHVLKAVFKGEIEEVFVIERDSGLLIGSYSQGNIADKDMVSGMLTAIKSFAEEAFKKEGQDLEDIKFETFQLSMMNFGSIYIATATSGVMNAYDKDALSDRMTDLAEKILRKKRSYMEDEGMLNELIRVVMIDTQSEE